MQIVHSITGLHRALNGVAPVLVPTMGNLHAGHVALVERAVQEARRDVVREGSGRGACGDALKGPGAEADTGKGAGKGTTDGASRAAPVVATIFVNRLQFLPHEDFDQYPRTFGQDCARLREAGCDIVFAPDEQELYPQPQTFRVMPDPAIADILEGEFRPGFFSGVCTVVLKLFACSGARAAVFGRKDYQQLAVIRRMVAQFALPVKIIAGDTVRASDGLALSSRNAYLSEPERAKAVELRRCLQWMAERLQAGVSLQEIEDGAMTRLRGLGWEPDYLTVRRQDDLQAPDAADLCSGDVPLVALGAARLGRTRLLDNLEIARSGEMVQPVQ